MDDYDQLREQWNNQFGPHRSLSPTEAQRNLDEWRIRAAAAALKEHACPRCGHPTWGDSEALCIDCDLETLNRFQDGWISESDS